MSVCFDTSVIVDILRGHAGAHAYAESLEDPPTCSEITRIEVMRGIQSGERRTTERVFESLQWVGLDEAIARRAGELGRTWRRSHPGIATADLIIAATAEELGMELATLNVKHFPMFKSLRPPYRASGD